MKRLLLTTAVCIGLLVLPAGAGATVRELGEKAPAAEVSCPENCQAIGRVTGYQGRSGPVTTPFRIPRKGTIVAWTITLGEPDANQIQFFTDLYGGPPQARLSIVRPGKRNKMGLPHRLVAQSPLETLDPYFGASPSFALEEPIRVGAGNVVALTVPTWAPAFAVGLGRDNWWRSSRSKGDCDNVSQRAATQAIGGIRHYGCTYRTARLLYTVTWVPDPRPTNEG
jgi:hypothetical protein